MDKVIVTQESAKVMADAAPASLTIQVLDADGNVLGSGVALKRTFSTGSIGYYFGEKVSLAGGVRVQASCNLTVIGTKVNA
jgi:hypothetical protein